MQPIWTARLSKRAFLATAATMFAGASLAACGGAVAGTPTQIASSQPSSSQRATAAGAVSASSAAAPSGATSSPASSTTSSVAKGGAHLTFWTTFDPAATQVFQRYVDAFNVEHPDNVVDHVRVDGSWEKITSAVAGNTAPDLNVSNPNFPARYAGQPGGMIAMDPYIHAPLPAGVPVDEYLPNPWNLYTWKGKQYGVPLQAAIKNFIYNKEIFDEAGVGELPTTWTAFVDLGNKVVQRNGNSLTRSFTDMASLNRPWHEFGYRNNMKMVSDDLTKSMANSDESIATVQFLLDLSNKYNLQPSTAAYNKQAVDFSSGHSVLHFGGFQDTTGLLKGNPKLQLGTLLFPYGPTPAKVTGIAGEAISIWGSSKDPAKAFQFVRYMCYEKNLQWCKDYFIISVLKKNLDDPFFKSDLLAPVVQTLATHSYEKWMYDLGNNFPHSPELLDSLNAGLDAAAKGTKTAQVAMNEVAAIQTALLQKYAGELQQFLHGTA